MESITRKFLVRQPPPLNVQEGIHEERYYLYRDKGIVIRIQSKGNQYELERKINTSNLLRESEKILITKEEFDSLRKTVSDKIVRETYYLSETPSIALRIYHGKFEGLVRAEVTFPSIKEAQDYAIPAWLGKEITDLVLSRDETLLGLTDEEFKKLLATT